MLRSKVNSRKVNSMKECLWPAGAAAFVMHSLVLSALALGMIPSEGSRPQSLKGNFYVEMVFDDEAQNNPLSHAIPDESRERSKAMITQVTCQKPKKFENTSPVNHEKSLKTPLRKSMAKGGQEGNQTPVSLSAPTLGSSSETMGASLLFNPPPVYPREARRKKSQGVVMVRVSLSKEGAVAKAITLPPRIDPILEDAALNAIRQWRFKPGMRTLEVPIEFRLVA